MRQKSNSASEKSAEYSKVNGEGGQSSGGCQEETAVPLFRFDFHSDEFNSIDELDDNTGNYRSFQSLAGIVTSDMRHHRQRKRLESSAPEDAEQETEVPAEEGFAGDEKEIKDPLPLTVVSKGRLLIIDLDLERALNCAERLDSQGITCTLCVPSRGSRGLSVTHIDSFPFVESDSVGVAGCFGGFTAAVTGADGRPVNLSTLTGHLSSPTGQVSGCFDLILDMQPTPSFAGQQLPVGYYAPGEDSQLLEAALAELPEMRGQFKKPQFTVVQADRCLHGRSRHDSCLRCVTVCPVAAIKSNHGKLMIDQYRCQGCGACSLVCPADAIKRLNPPQEELLSELGRRLSEALAISNSPLDVIFYDHDIDEGPPDSRIGMISDRTIFFEVENIGHIGLEVFLVALAYGASRVFLVCDRMRPTGTRDALKSQIRLGAAILHGLGMSGDCLCFSETLARKSGDELAGGDRRTATGNVRGVGVPAALNPDLPKRTLIRRAAEHLCRMTDAPPAVVPLPMGSPFGTVRIKESCSFCMACVSSCPSGALAAGGDLPQLSLVESRCHQCGFCAEVCPEEAIELQARLLCDTEAADSPAVLREDAPFKCVQCGEPFGSLAMIDRMQKKLGGHWMYNSNRQLRRLQMCRTCRTRDALSAGDHRL